MFDYLPLAVRALKLNKVRSFLTMLGVIIGVSAVITLTSIVGGLEKTIRTQFESFGSNSLYLFPGEPGGGRGPGGTAVNKLSFDYTKIINNVPNVLDASAMVFTTGDAKYLNKSSTNVTINGIEDNLDEISGIGVVEGRTISKSDMAGSKLVAVIGQTVKKNLFDELSPIGKTITLKNKKFEVIGVTEKQGAVFGVDQDNEVNIPLNTARQRFQIDRPNFFFIKVDNPQNIDSAKRGIEKAIRKFLDKEDFSVVSQEQSLEFIGNILGVLATALGGIAAISLLVGGVGIMNIMFVSVTERTREIGLRKAVGANSKNILTQFLFEAVILSLLGGLMGVLVGIIFTTLLGNFIDTAISPLYVLLSFGVSAAIGIIFGVAPAIKASKMDPITALRYE